MADGMPGPRSGERRISLVFFDAGGGHRNAATALKVEIERQRLPFEVSLVNLQEVLDPWTFFGSSPAFDSGPL